VRIVAVLVALASLAAACGSRLPDKVLSQFDAQRTGANGAVATGGSGSAGGDSIGTASCAAAGTDGGAA